MVMFPVPHVWPGPSCRARCVCVEGGERGQGRQRKRGGGRHRGVGRPGVRLVPGDIGEQGRMGRAGCKITYGAPTTLPVKGLMMMVKDRGGVGRGSGGGWREKEEEGNRKGRKLMGTQRKLLRNLNKKLQTI